jgi:hypothetical protein
MGEGRKFLNDPWNIQGFGEMNIKRRNAGKQCPSRDAGMAPQEGGGTIPVPIPCSPSAHAGSSDLQTMGGARSTGAVESARVSFRGKEDEQIWKDRYLYCGL